MSGIEIFDQTWQVPARTIDMLGRQQIANIPTALHELFKNAHDAYAEHVVADYYRADGMLLVRDDGDGMTGDQLRKGWLTLASSAKRDANKTPSGRQDGKPTRAIMGEKGIGRLAIAAIGSQVLILTRARAATDEEQPLYVSLVNWGVNELPDVDLSRIVVPTMIVRGDGLPSGSDIGALAARLATNVEELRTPANDALVTTILGQLAALDIDPAIDLSGLPGPTLANGAHGTQFVVTPVSEMLSSDLEQPSDDEVSQVQKYLLGFSNTMMPARLRPTIVATLNDHHEDGTTDTPIGESEFFTPDDFANADHTIEGSFNEYGQFEGTIRVYGGTPTQHEIHWPGTGGPTRCGPFRITFAYLQGRLPDSLLDADTFALMSNKLNRIGGLYVYRDGIRILPYGGPEQDFIGLERSRTKSASDWFFSYRRIFGAVELSHADNPDLREKAGREGFIRDGAYKDFVSILQNFFANLAIDFFRETSPHGEWSERRAERNRVVAALAARQKSAKGKLARFDKDMNRLFEKIEQGRLSSVAADIRRDLASGLGAAAEMGDADRAAAAVAETERRLAKRVDDLEAGLIIALPRGAALNQRRTKDWNAYTANLAKVRNEILGPLRADIREDVSDLIGKRGLALDRRKRIAESLSGRGDRAKSNANRLRGRVDERLSNLRDEVERALKRSVADLSAKIVGAQTEFESTDLAAADERRVGDLQGHWEEAIDASARETTTHLEALADQLDSLMEAVKRGETLDRTTDLIEGQSEAYREQLDRYVELAQLGTAVGIVQHEFVSAVKGVRTAIRKLEPWARTNPDLGALNRDLRDGFEHLDAYLNLFTPLSRRLTATRVDVSGGQIEGYLDEVFRERLTRHGVSLRVSDEFRAAKLPGQPSAVLAAFVNLVDNAIHWTTTVKDGERSITLGVDGDGMTVANSGPGIEPRIAQRIFEHGETTRLGGRGLGLFVSREALKRSGLGLELVTARRNESPVFRVGPHRPDQVEELGA